jgi:hypothetical protein
MTALQFHNLMPILIANTPTGIFPAWIPAAEFVPNNLRLVLASDEECIFIAYYAQGGTALDGVWCDAHTEESFDSVITKWMECPTDL